MPQLKHTVASHTWSLWIALSAALATSILTGCGTLGSGSIPQMCLDVEASVNLNQFEGQPHVVVLYFYPLQTETAFRAADLRRLASGDKPSGITGDRWEATVLPGQRIELTEKLPRDTAYVGVVADFYNKPSGAVVKPSCGWFRGAKVVLSATDMQVAD